MQHRVLVLLVLCLGFALRQVALPDMPPFVHGDGANLAKYSLRVARGDQPWYGVRADGDANWAFLQFAPYTLLGNDLMALRFMSACWGMLSLAGAYYGTRRLFGARVALFALCLMASGHLLIHFSRAATIVMPSVLTSFAAVGMFLRAQDADRTGRARWTAFALAGAIAALNLYEYAAAKAVFFGLAVLWATTFPLRRGSRSQWLVGTAALAAGAAVVAAPIIFWYVQQPGQVGIRFTELSVLNPRYAALNLKLYGTQDSQTVLIRQIIRSLGGFFIVNDTSPIYRIQAPLMDLPTAILSAVGLVIAARRQRRRTLALVAWLMAGLIAGAILLIEPPTSYHYIVLVPLAMVFAAVALDAMFSRWVGRLWVPIIIAGIVVLNIQIYFADYPTQGAWHSAESSIGFYARKHSPCCRFVYIGYPDMTPREITQLAAAPATVEYVWSTDYLDTQQTDVSRDRRPWVFFVTLDRPGQLELLQRRFPRSRVGLYEERGRTMFWTVIVDDPQVARNPAVTAPAQTVPSRFDGAFSSR